MGSTLHVDGLLTSVSEQELKDMFTQLGNVVKANGRWKTKSTTEGVMNQTQFQSFWEQLKAPLKNQWEQFTNEDLVQIQGDLATFNSKVDTRYSEKKDEVKKWANRRYAHWSGWYEGYEDRKSIA